MDDAAFDSVTRRLSLVSLSAAGLAAFASSRVTDARNSAKKKLKKKQQQKCQAQAGACETLLNRICVEDNEGDPGDIQSCLETAQRCCPLLATCDFAAYIQCAD
jgi:hypothetical protein